MRKTLAISLCLLTAACASPEQVEQQRAMREQADINTCLGYGFKQGTEGFANCRLQLEVSRMQTAPRPYYYNPPPYYLYGRWY